MLSPLSAAAGGGASEWTALDDTPGSITALQFVRGNAGGTALEFVDPGLGNYLRRDGSNTITGNILPDSSATRSLGSTASRLDRVSGKQGLFISIDGPDPTVTFDETYVPQGGLILGNSTDKGSGTNEFILGGYYYSPIILAGNLRSAAGTTARMKHQAGGGSMFGSAFSGSGVAELVSSPYAYGSFTGGYSFASGGNTLARIYTGNAGSFVWTYSGASSNGTGIGQSTGPGSFCAGIVGGSNTTFTLEATNAGSFAAGHCQGVTGPAAITSSGLGSFAVGRTQNYAYIQATGRGAFAQGNAQNTGVYILSSGNGAFAQGHVANSAANIRATGFGAFAQGEATNGNYIAATGKGAFAQGDAVGGNIVASGVGAVQFGIGVNAVANSLQLGQTTALGTGLHFHSGGAPAVPVNGDMWVTAAGIVTIQSGGVACACTNAVM